MTNIRKISRKSFLYFINGLKIKVCSSKLSMGYLHPMMPSTANKTFNSPCFFDRLFSSPDLLHKLTINGHSTNNKSYPQGVSAPKINNI